MDLHCHYAIIERGLPGFWGAMRLQKYSLSWTRRLPGRRGKKKVQLRLWEKEIKNKWRATRSRSSWRRSSAMESPLYYQSLLWYSALNPHMQIGRIFQQLYSREGPCADEILKTCCVLWMPAQIKKPKNPRKEISLKTPKINRMWSPPYYKGLSWRYKT